MKHRRAFYRQLSGYYAISRPTSSSKKSQEDRRQDEQKQPNNPDYPQNVLLTNGRFPVSLDLARQFTLSGCRVYCVDPMKFHICWFSRMVTGSKVVSAPRKDPLGYVQDVKEAVQNWQITYIIPIHEEEFYLAASGDPEILDKLYAPPWEVLLRLHSKLDYAKMMRQFRLDVPEFYVCKNMDEVYSLNPQKEWAVKPVFGRANTNVYHLKPGHRIPPIGISEDCQYIAQEWIHGNRYCSYSLFDHGTLKVHGVYPVLETIDGSSCVYFQPCHHLKINQYVEQLAAHLYPLHGQIGLDFVQTEDRLVTIDSNPRATSGIHLWSGTGSLALAFTHRLKEDVIRPPHASSGGAIHREVIPGMLMWEHKNVTVSRYLKHIWRLISARDIIWNWSDLMPSLASPFLLTYYYALCRQCNLTLPNLFQWDLIWEPPSKESLDTAVAMTIEEGAGA
ncbi:hypothetical protein P175DRAFT_0525251, partial [Aspergillus ochraceoroseus IBT 24754]|uniref:ATP-grasp fold PylC-type domain-containing protein n=2 Tax=Aspergillus ochraceoroseus TaxID=138278 RepID=A0A0F8WDN0_9EURO